MEEEQRFIGEVWHNLGCCYGMCFLFEDALRCFKAAYSYSFLKETQDAVAFVIKHMEKSEKEPENSADTFLNYVNYTAQAGRENRYEQIAQRVEEYRRGVEE